MSFDDSGCLVGQNLGGKQSQKYDGAAFAQVFQT